LRERLPGYEHLEALISFVRRVQDLQPAAVILFGSLAKGNYYLRSDADICVILSQPQVSWAEGYELVAALNEGVVQKLVYGAEQFLQMIRDANALALEVCHDGWALAGEEGYVRRVEETFWQTKRRWGLVKTESGWLIRKRG
jgi:predicted nucleotidyltransferase